jgi:hypothetical protein
MITTILKFAALLFVSVVGLFYIKSANFTPWNISGEGATGAIGAGMPLPAAKDGLSAERFNRISTRGVPAFRHHRLHRAGIDCDGHQLH